jgi:hypothetical protein
LGVIDDMPFFSLSSKSQNKPPPGNRFPISAQSMDSAVFKLLSFPERFFKKIDSRINNLDTK